MNLARIRASRTMHFCTQSQAERCSYPSTRFVSPQNLFARRQTTTTCNLVVFTRQIKVFLLATKKSDVAASKSLSRQVGPQPGTRSRIRKHSQLRSQNNKHHAYLIPGYSPSARRAHICTSQPRIRQVSDCGSSSIRRFPADIRSRHP